MVFVSPAQRCFNRSGSYRDSQFEIEAVDSIDLAGPAHAIVAETVQFTSTANKKRTGNVRLPPPKKAKGKGKATTHTMSYLKQKMLCFESTFQNMQIHHLSVVVMIIIQ